MLDLYEYVAERGGAERALRYIDRVEAACRRLTTFPERGTRRDDVRPGLRVFGFERRAVIAFQLTDEVVTILRILYGGREMDAALRVPEDPS